VGDLESSDGAWAGYCAHRDRSVEEVNDVEGQRPRFVAVRSRGWVIPE